MIPAKLKKGDEIRVVSPAHSLAVVSQDVRDCALDRLDGLGFRVSFSKHAEEIDEFGSSSIQSRVGDIHDAFEDEEVKAIMTTLGGFNSNQLLRYLNWDLIGSESKILCGYSDITALQNAIWAKTNLVTYSGPHFSTLGMLKGLGYTIDYFQRCLVAIDSIDVRPSDTWSDDRWFQDQENREFKKNEGFVTIREGNAEGTIIGGNLGTFQLLYGTEYMPELSDTILFLEECVESKERFIQDFDRHLQSLIHQPRFGEVRGIVIGRFELASGMTNEELARVINEKKELDDIPVIAGVDFGHTTPQITFPIGGKARLLASENEVKLRVTDH